MIEAFHIQDSVIAHDREFYNYRKKRTNFSSLSIERANLNEDDMIT